MGINNELMKSLLQCLSPSQLISWSSWSKAHRLAKRHADFTSHLFLNWSQQHRIPHLKAKQHTWPKGGRNLSSQLGLSSDSKASSLDTKDSWTHSDSSGIKLLQEIHPQKVFRNLMNVPNTPLSHLHSSWQHHQQLETFELQHAHILDPLCRPAGSRRHLTPPPIHHLPSWMKVPSSNVI